MVTQRIAQDLCARLAVLLDLGLGYLSLDRSTPTLSPGELQRLRLATQVRSNLFGVVYVLDEPSAGLHPADTEALLAALEKLKASGNSLFVVEHELDVIRHADWIVDVGPAAGEKGGEILYSGPPAGLADVDGVADAAASLSTITRRRGDTPREPQRLAAARAASRATICAQLDVAFPLGVFTTVTGVSGSGKSSLVSQVLVELVAKHLGHEAPEDEEEGEELERTTVVTEGGEITGGMEADQAARARGSESRSAARRARISRPTPGCSIMCASSSPRRMTRERASLRRGPVFVQRGEGPLRNVRGRRLRVRRAALPAERLCAVPGLPRRALQREDARDPLPRQEHRRSARPDRRCRGGFLRRRAAPRALARRAAASRARLSAPRPARDRTFRRRGAAHQARDRTAAPRAAATRSTFSTSRRPACTRPTWRS